MRTQNVAKGAAHLFPHLFLVDYELRGSSASGLEMIHELRVKERAILVTHRFEDEGVIVHCTREGVRLLPKSMVPSISLER